MLTLEMSRPVSMIVVATRMSISPLIKLNMIFSRQPGTKEIEMAEAMMEKTGITHLASKDCNRMSGGELQMRHL